MIITLILEIEWLRREPCPIRPHNHFAYDMESTASSISIYESSRVSYESSRRSPARPIAQTELSRRQKLLIGA